MTTNPTRAVNVTAAQRRQEVLKLRIEGLTLPAIGERVGVSKQAVHTHIRRALGELAKASAGATEELRELQNERLEGLVLTFWPKAEAGDIQAAKVILDICARQARLFGLDAPTKVAQTSPDGEQSCEVAGTRWVYFLPEPTLTEEEWLAQQPGITENNERPDQRNL